MREKIGISFDFELEEEEKVVLESPTVTDIELRNKQISFKQLSERKSREGYLLNLILLTKEF